MWNELQSSPPFYILYKKHNKHHHIFITDYVRIWKLYLSEKELLHCLKESNITLEMEEDELLQNAVHLLTHPKDLKKVNIAHNGVCLIVSLTLHHEFPFKLKLNLTESSKELFFQKVIQPALKTINDLKCSENELRNLLKKKDEEIDEYKSQGGNIRYTALPKYNDEIHMQKHAEYKKHFLMEEIPSALLEKTVCVSTEDDVIDETNVRQSVKSEPQSQEIATNTPQINRLIEIKQEYMKNELPKVKKRRQINL